MTKSSTQTADRVTLNGRSDFTAICLSTLCIVHCLALPLMASALPLAGVLAEIEWIHRGLVLTAIPISTYAILKTGLRVIDGIFIGLVLVGFSLLLIAGFVEQAHDYEKQLTTVGALMVAGAHLRRWLRHSK